LRQWRFQTDKDKQGEAAGWAKADFDDSAWPHATEYEADAVTHDPAYRYDTKRFGDASFIWSKNLVVDNTVLCRSR
jgi:hypothetical protein